ncbi:methylated-DNA--[protein]-cysteine S-methyltransferase [Psychrobacter sp. I-STPA6b]|uniref:methylated-DNA--[protein]-cysteine S-methyltransferase n=1 Tax=Psychrobacter sp. I-STPA6b TaxID=2585718 RepID=UPI001D0CC7AC|nr:methylated-DNA--[protein]-cysteine S-methyltransferase [Psychrobacter sp. I-STPA6b]
MKPASSLPTFDTSHDKDNLAELLTIVDDIIKQFTIKKPAIKDSTKTTQLIMDFYSSPLGTMCLIADEQFLFLLEFVDRKNAGKQLQDLLKRLNATLKTGENSITIKTKKQLQQYFAGTLQHFDIPIKLLGTDFQISVWQTLLTIPYGTTISYAEQASQMNNPKAVRAVANANSRNRLSIIVPCHRVIGSDGSLTGYAGKVERKAWLLGFEGNNLP